MRKLAIGDGYIILDDGELEHSSQEITVEDLRLDRDEILENKLRTYRRNEPEYRKLLSRTYYDTRQVARRKGINFPMGKQEFIEALTSLPLEGGEERTTLADMIQLGKRITRISPQKEGMDIYYRDRYIDTIVYNI